MQRTNQVDQGADIAGAPATARITKPAATSITPIEITGREVLKTAPRGYPKDHARIQWLRHKSLIAWREWSAGAWLGTSRAKDRIVAFLHQARPLRDWLDAHVGESELDDGWGR